MKVLLAHYAFTKLIIKVDLQIDLMGVIMVFTLLTI